MIPGNYKNQWLPWPVLLLVLCVYPLSADELLLRNGKRLEGTIVNQNREYVYIQTAKGRKKVAKSQVRRIRYGSSSKQNGTRHQKSKQAQDNKSRQENGQKSGQKEEPSHKIEFRDSKITVEEKNSSSNTRKARSRDRQTEGEKQKKPAIVQERRTDQEIGRLLRKERKLWVYMHRDNRLDGAERKKSADKNKPSSVVVWDTPVTDLNDTASTGYWWRSLLIPGWGQYHGSRNIRASLYGGLVLLAAGVSGSEYVAARSSKDSYESTVNTMPLVLPGLVSSAGPMTAGIIPNNEIGQIYLFRYMGDLMAAGQRSSYESHTANHQAAAAALGLIYLVQLTDALFFMDSSDRSDPGVEDLSWYIGTGLDQNSFAAIPAGVFSSSSQHNHKLSQKKAHISFQLQYRF